MSDFNRYQKGVPIAFPDDYPPAPVDSCCRFEFGLVDHGDAKRWRRATADEFRKALAAVGKSSVSIEAILDHQKHADLERMRVPLGLAVM